MNTSVGGAGGTAPAPAPEATAVTTAVPAAVSTAPAGGATTSASQPGLAPPASNPPSTGFNFTTFVPIILMFVLLYFFLFRGQRKEEKKRKEMINELKKGDRVMTIGGMIARVVSIDGDEVVLKIDESANVKATYTKKSIQEVLDRDDKK